jgi:hypothetical protein
VHPAGARSEGSSTSDPHWRVEYARRVYDSILDWYKAADLKAQVALTANGTFLTILAGLALAKPSDTTAATATFGAETWLFLGLMAAAMAGSFVSATACLHSRLYNKQELARALDEYGALRPDPPPYHPSLVWFFEFVGALDAEALASRFLTADPIDLESRALAWQCVRLGKRVTQKHVWLNRSFLLTGASLFFLLATAVSYLVRSAA